jgi:hypothetical protein
MPQWKDQFPGVEDMSVAVMGCVVNGPGESKLANIGISLPGTGEIPVAPVFVDGEKTVTLKGDKIANEFKSDCDELCGIALFKVKITTMAQKLQSIKGFYDVLPIRHRFGILLKIRFVKY